MRNSFLRQKRIFTPEEAAEMLLVTIIGLFMNYPYSLVSSTSHKKQLMSIVYTITSSAMHIRVRYGRTDIHASYSMNFKLIFLPLFCASVNSGTHHRLYS